MRMSGLLGAAIAFSMLTPIAPADAVTISPGALLYTDLYKWQGQDGTPTWRQILANFDGTEELTFYFWNAPSPPPAVTTTPPPVTNPADPSVGAGDPLDPIGTPGGASWVTTASELDSSVVYLTTTGGGGAFLVGVAVPEPTTWAMMLIGFAGLGYAGYRQAKRVSRARA
jgi:hypothetical protein